MDKKGINQGVKTKMETYICLRDFLDWEAIEECVIEEFGLPVGKKLALDLEPTEAKVIVR